jgi:hypothetical protein
MKTSQNDDRESLKFIGNGSGFLLPNGNRVHAWMVEDKSILFEFKKADNSKYLRLSVDAQKAVLELIEILHGRKPTPLVPDVESELLISS